MFYTGFDGYWNNFSILTQRHVLEIFLLVEKQPLTYSMHLYFNGSKIQVKQSRSSSIFFSSLHKTRNKTISHRTMFSFLGKWSVLYFCFCDHLHLPTRHVDCLAAILIFFTRYCSTCNLPGRCLSVICLSVFLNIAYSLLLKQLRSHFTRSHISCTHKWKKYRNNSLRLPCKYLEITENTVNSFETFHMHLLNEWWMPKLF